MLRFQELHELLAFFSDVLGWCIHLCLPQLHVVFWPPLLLERDVEGEGRSAYGPGDSQRVHGVRQAVGPEERCGVVGPVFLPVDSFVVLELAWQLKLTSVVFVPVVAVRHQAVGELPEDFGRTVLRVFCT